MIAARIGPQNLLRAVSFGARRQCTETPISSLQESALQERCILVDDADRVVGEASKLDCHRVRQDGSLPLHRAFSIFLFNNKGEFLLQKRASSKVTFPGHYSNTCCSHPLTDFPEETEERDALGIRKAAQRRFTYELGIPSDQIKPSDFTYITRIHYEATNDGYWGEHEISYILFIQRSDLIFLPNPDEISELRWITKAKLLELIDTTDEPITPWFHLIAEHQLPRWWDNLHALSKVQNHTYIRRFM